MTDGLATHHAIARDLVAIESTTGNEEGVVAYLETHLRGMGLETRSDEVAPGRRNLAAGPRRPTLLFSTHTDTVPPHVPPREDAERIWGRGACDTKGITACFLEAGRRLLAEGITDFGYLFVVGEEVDNVGARAGHRIAESEYILIGEPTENRLVVGHKGLLGVRVNVTGRACHSAYPEEGDSAIHRLLDALERVRRVDFGTSELLGPATTNIGMIHGGEAHNLLAPSAHATVTIRVVDDIDRVERDLRAALCDPATGRPDPRIEMQIFCRMSAPRLERLEGFETAVVSYGTDASFLENVGRPILLGPGSIKVAHTLEEHIEKRSMDLAVEQYVEIAKRLIAARG